MASGLGAVHQHGDAPLMGQADDLLHRVHHAEGVGHVGQGHQFGGRGEGLAEPRPVRLSAGQDGHHLEVQPLALAQLLPGHKVGVVLAAQSENPVPRLAEGLQIAVSHQVDGPRGPAGEHHGVVFTSPKEAAHLVPGLLKAAGHLPAQAVGAAVDVGVAGDSGLRQGVQHRLGPLGGGGVVQISPLPIRQQGEILPVHHRFTLSYKASASWRTV